MEIMALGLFGIIVALLAWAAWTVSLQARLGAFERDRDEWKVRAEAAEGALALYKAGQEVQSRAEGDARLVGPGTVFGLLLPGGGVASPLAAEPEVRDPPPDAGGSGDVPPTAGTAPTRRVS